MKRRIKKGGYSAVLCLVVIAAVAVGNLLVGRLPEEVRRWDISRTNLYELGDTTREVVGNLKSDVTIYVVADPEYADQRITRFVNEYEGLSDHIKVEAVDPVLHPSQVSSLGAEPDSLLVSCEATGRKETVPFADMIKIDEMAYYSYGQIRETEFDGEGRLTSAISKVTSDVKKNLYAVQGHGEIGIMGGAADLLEKSGFSLETVNLMGNGGVPEDCDLLILNGPQKDLGESEKSAVEEYLDGGGHVMILAGAAQAERPNLKALTNRYGMDLRDGFAADLGQWKHNQNNPFAIFPTYEFGSEVMNGIDGSSLAYMDGCAVITQTDSVREGVTVTPFLTTSEEGQQVTENGQEQGVFLLGATAREGLESGEARLTVFAGPSLIDADLNAQNANLANLEIFMNAVTWNFDDVQNVSIPAKSLEITYNSIRAGGLWGGLIIVIIPVVVLITGFVIWLKRRRL